jgi:ATP-dependent Lon protease
VPKYRHGVSDEENQVGAVTGLAWTEVGGELLTIERDRSGQGRRAHDRQAGRSDERERPDGVQLRQGAQPAYGIKPSIFQRKDLHIHLPEGAVPKDGPSAGIGMVTAMVSTLTGIPVRADVAMTGEVTLRAACWPSAASRKSCWQRCGAGSRPS